MSDHAVAALNALDTGVIGYCMPPTSRVHPLFRCSLETEVPSGKRIEAVVDNYPTHEHPKKGCPRAASALDVSLHTDFKGLVQRRREQAR